MSDVNHVFCPACAVLVPPKLSASRVPVTRQLIIRVDCSVCGHGIELATQPTSTMDTKPSSSK